MSSSGTSNSSSNSECSSDYLSSNVVNSKYSDAYVELVHKLEYLKNTNLLYLVNETGLLENLIDNLQNNKIVYNKNSGLLNQRKKCFPFRYSSNLGGVVQDESDIDNLLMDHIDVIYHYAVQFDIYEAPKTVVFGVNIKSSKFWL